jgi:hypothetical protein
MRRYFREIEIVLANEVRALLEIPRVFTGFAFDQPRRGRANEITSLAV